MRRTVALIPARGGSKGIPRKNLAVVGGRPLVSYTIEAAMQARGIAETYVSSDDECILDVGRAAGCIALKRPAAFSSDDSNAVDVVSHLLATALAEADDETAIVYLQPTSPFRNASHIEAALDLMERARSKAVVSVTELVKSPYKSFVLNERGELQSLFEETLSNANRQALPPAFSPNGAIYGFLVGTYRKRPVFPSNGSLPYLMNRRDSIDIDTPDDLAIVRALMEHRHA